MIVFVVNCGSSSLKYQLLDMDNESVMAKGLVERIGLPGARLIHKLPNGRKTTVEADIHDHRIAIKLVISVLTDENYGVIDSMEAIDAVGHRVVHGGELFAESCLINDKVLKGILECADLAPLHNPPNILGIEACANVLPGVPQVAVFDTAFHQTMPDYAYIYGLPYDAYEKYRVRRYGFHGTSHKYVAKRVAEMMGEHMTDLRIITCHLGNGCSLAAVKYGKVIDTSMGFTPLDGLVMGTRCGEVDPAIVAYLMEKEKMTPEEMEEYLNKKSGVLGISGLSSDFRDIVAGYNAGNDRCRLAWDIFAYRVRKTIGSYVAAMGGVDAIVFTAGIGENSPEMRASICEGLEYLGTRVDSFRNRAMGEEAEISAPRSRVQIFVVPTNEELVIARDTAKLCKDLVMH